MYWIDFFTLIDERKAIHFCKKILFFESQDSKFFKSLEIIIN